MILLIDNYDSFTYNVYQYVGSVINDIKVTRNDMITIDEIKKLAPDKIIISPGPGIPDDAGICIDIIKEFGQTIPILGICLGHQCMAQVFGATISHAKTLCHGKFSMLTYKNSKLLLGVKQPFKAARYHSLAIVEETLPDCFITTSQAPDGEIMAIEHKTYPLFGLQFHPESIYTPQGMTIIRNFLKMERAGNDKK